jgi:N-acetylmuramoyl-L-alanine amidase
MVWERRGALKMLRTLAAIVCVVVAGNTACHAQASLKAYRIEGTSYVAVPDIARLYNLGRDASASVEYADYRTTSARLSAQAEQRDIVLNGVNHWLSFPVQSYRGRLWISDVDVLKVLDPVLRPDTARPGNFIRTIVLDPGHGGRERGTHGATGAAEKTLTLDLAQRVQRLLAGNGRRVVLTRTSDRPVSLDERAEFARSQRADLFVSLHFNSGGSASGIETFCLPPAGAASTAQLSGRTGGAGKEQGNRFDLGNVWLAHCVQKTLLQATGAADRGVRRARFAVLRDAPCPAILVEAGFLSNRSEERKILTVEYREQLAKAVASGILEYKRSIETR